MLVGPVLRDSWGSGEVRERRLGIKRASLEKAEENALKKSAQDKEEDKVGGGGEGGGIGRGRGGSVLFVCLSCLSGVFRFVDLFACLVFSLAGYLSA